MGQWYNIEISSAQPSTFICIPQQMSFQDGMGKRKVLVQGFQQCPPWSPMTPAAPRGTTKPSQVLCPILSVSSPSQWRWRCSGSSSFVLLRLMSSCFVAAAQENHKLEKFGYPCPSGSLFFMPLPPFHETALHPEYCSQIHETSSLTSSRVPERHVENECLTSGVRTKEERDQTKCSISPSFCS